MKLYYIGNGFDLAHNLPTRYLDFKEYFKINYPEYYYRFIENGSNQYALQCLYPSTTPLDITFSFADVVLKKQIKLLPLF